MKRQQSNKGQGLCENLGLPAPMVPIVKQGQLLLQMSISRVFHGLWIDSRARVEGFAMRPRKLSCGVSPKDFFTGPGFSVDFA